MIAGCGSVQVPLSPGMRHELKIPFAGEADQVVSYDKI